MSLIFVYGNSGSGKSEYMYQKFADMAEHAPYQHYFVVVPEQFTMNAQRKLVDHSSSGVITNIDVVSFDRLAYRVFDELGVHLTVMEETGKSLVLRRIVEENESDLTILKRNLTKMGYIGELKSVISELMQYGISPDDLEDFIDELSEESPLSYKLRDILQIYRSFDDYLGEGYVTAERVLDLLIDVAGESSLLKDAVFLFDGYTGFTPVQMNLISRLMHIVSDIYVTVTLDTREQLYEKAQMEDLFYMSRKMINSLAKAAREASFEIGEPVMVESGDKSRFHDNPVLFHLEQNLFRLTADIYEETCGDHLRIDSLLTPKDEFHYVAAMIRTLVREKGFRYRDFAIVCSDVEKYGKYADAVFKLYDIPGYVDKKQSLLYHPLIELIRSLSEMAEDDYSLESVFRFLRTGFAGFTTDEIDRLENYCIAKGIRGKTRWHSEFESLPSRHGNLRYNEERALRELDDMNALRERFAKLTDEVIVVFCRKDATVLERTGALYGMLCSLNIESKLQGETKRFEENGDEVAASVNRQIYKIVIDLLDKMVDLLGDEVISASEYDEILEAGFDSARVGTIPPGNDCVILGDIERSRFDEIKVLFLLGVNDGEIPKKLNRQSILSEHDREVMEKHDLELAPGEREQMFLQRFYLYLALTKPSDCLWITYSRMDVDGSAIRPSYLVETLKNMFEELPIGEFASNDLLPLVSPKSSIGSWINGLIESDSGQISPRWKALHNWFMRDPEWKNRIGALFDAHFSVYKKSDLSTDLNRALYGDILYNSFSRLDEFGRCPYRHFLDYGLKLAEREEFTFTSPEMGTLFHDTLEKFGNLLEENDSWSDLTDERRDEILRESLESVVQESFDPGLFESASDAYDLERAYRILSTTVWAITEQISRGDYRPAGYEINIDTEIMKNEHREEDNPDADTTGEDEVPVRGRLTGRIDRMDICVDDDRVAVRVIDYKSGIKSLNLGDIYYGRNLQLPVYLDAAMEYLSKEYPDREVIPAGIFYSHVDDPVLTDQVKDEEESRKKRLGKLKLSGFINSDDSVVYRMDPSVEMGGVSEILPVSITKEGNFYSSCKSPMPTESFEDLIDYVRLIIDETSHRMAEGEIGVEPYRQKGNTGCEYCTLKGICGFDRKVPGYSYREEENLKDEEAMDLMRKKLNGASEE